jgi:molybdate transport system substrate-binding protein
MRRGRTAAIFALALLAFSAAFAQPRPLTIAAAADLQPVLPALLQEFQSRTGIPTVAVYASSATLATQIINGGPYDLMLAADLSFPEKVIAAGLGESAKPIPYARGTLVLWARKDSPLLQGGKDPAGLSIDAMRSPDLHKLALADASHAPYGRAAMAAIAKLGLAETLKNKLAIAENIAQAAQFAESGNAQAGLISLTSALTPQLESSGSYIRLPPHSYPPILQGAVIVKGARHQAEAQRFLNFLLSPEVGKQLAARGLREP